MFSYEIIHYLNILFLFYFVYQFKIWQRVMDFKIDFYLKIQFKLNYIQFKLPGGKIF